MARQEIVHPGAPVVLARDATSVGPVAVHKHAKRIHLPEGVIERAILQNLLKAVSFPVGQPWSPIFALRVVNVLLVADDVQITAHYNRLPRLLLQALYVPLECPVPLFNSVVKPLEVSYA